MYFSQCFLIIPFLNCQSCAALLQFHFVCIGRSVCLFFRCCPWSPIWCLPYLASSLSFSSILTFSLTFSSKLAYLLTFCFLSLIFLINISLHLTILINIFIRVSFLIRIIINLNALINMKMLEIAPQPGRERFVTVTPKGIILNSVKGDYFSKPRRKEPTLRNARMKFPAHRHNNRYLHFTERGYYLLLFVCLFIARVHVILL